MKYNDPFYFAIKDGTPTAERAAVPAKVAVTYGLTGFIEFVRAEPGFRLYRLWHGTGR